MKATEVPQDKSRIFGGQRKAVYALGEDGRYTTVPSDGWSVEETVTSAAVEAYQAFAREAHARVLSGLSSPLEFHMYDRRMDVPMLAETVGIWRWRVRRHLRPAPFTKMKDKMIKRYADALGIEPEDLRRLPQEPSGE